jgi:uncharacterized protein
MRLDHSEKLALDLALEGVPGEVFLFGSRTDDNARGGDIDLLVFSAEEPNRLARRIATRFFANCEERIDVLVVNPEAMEPEQRAFLRTLNLVPLESAA